MNFETCGLSSDRHLPSDFCWVRAVGSKLSAVGRH